MASTFTTRYKYEQPANGDLPGTWGGRVNLTITALLDESIDAVSSIALADADTALTIPNAVSSPNRAGTLEITGALTAIRTLTIPAGDRVLRVINATTGGFALNVKNPTSGTVSVANGYMATIYFIGAVATSPSYQIAATTIGTATITTAASLADGTAASPALRFTADTNTGFYRIGADQIGVSTGGALSATFATAMATLATDLTVGKATPSIFLDGASGGNHSLTTTVGGVLRWSLQLGNSTAEAGADSGSDFSVLRYNDAGVSQGWLFNAARSTGDIAIGGPSPLIGTKLYVAIPSAAAVVDANALRVINLNTANDTTVAIDFATAAGTLRGQVRGKREVATTNGSLILSSSLAGVAQDAITIASSRQVTFSGASPVILPAGVAPTLGDHATNKTYVDTGDRWVQIANAAVSTAALLDVTWASGTYRVVRFYLLGWMPVSPGASNDTHMRVSVGGSFVAGVSDYGNTGVAYFGGAANIINTSSSLLPLTIWGINASVDPAVIQGIVSCGIGEPGEEPVVQWQSTYSANAARATLLGSTGVDVIGPVDGLRFFYSASNIATRGRIYVEGLKT